MKKRYKLFLLFLVLFLIFICMLSLNANTPMLTDDFIYQFVFESRMPTGSTRRLANIFDIFHGMAIHWKIWGGRVTIHFLLQLAFLIGMNFFNVLNSLMFIALGWLIYRHVNDSKNIKLSWLITIYTVLFIFVPQPGATILWKSGSANYLWSSVLILLMTLLLKRNFERENYIKDTPINCILMSLFGLFIGCANENSGCALIVAMGLFAVLYRIKYKKIPKWCLFTLGCTILSYVFLLVSPGNYIRADEMYPGVTYSFMNIIQYTLKITKLSYEYLGTIIGFAIITTIFAFKKKNNILEYINSYGSQIIFLSFILISIYSLVLSPAYPERCWMFAFVYLVILIGLNINSIADSKKNTIIVSKLILFLAIFLSMRFIYEYNVAYNDIVETNSCIIDHQLQIQQELEAGNRNVVVHGVPESVGKYNAFSYNGYLTYSEGAWTNSWIAEYYGLDSIVASD